MLVVSYELYDQTSDRHCQYGGPFSGLCLSLSSLCSSLHNVALLQPPPSFLLSPLAAWLEMSPSKAS